VATGSKVKVGSCLLGGIVGLNPTGGMDVCLLSKGVLLRVYVPLRVIRCNNNHLHIQ